jgi:hypothetical protein
MSVGCATGPAVAQWGNPTPATDGQRPADAPPASMGLGFLHPLPPCDPDLRARCLAVPDTNRDRVHVFFVNGVDPLCLGNLNSLCAHLQQLGFRNSHFGQLWSTPLCVSKLRRLKREDPGARVVLLGYSAGANAVRWVANRLNKEGVPVDLLVYLGGDLIDDSDRSRPENVGGVLNITGHGLILYGHDLVWKGSDIEKAKNVRLDARHICLPSQRETIDTLARALATLADAPRPGGPAAR